MIWARLAPRARVSASSRIRWATMMEKVLRIRKIPTNRATAAKPSRMLLKKLRAFFHLGGLFGAEFFAGVYLVAGTEGGGDVVA